MVYEGQPDYVRVGFLCDLFEPWCRIEGSEWGEWTSSLHQAVQCAISISIEDKAAAMLDWLREELIAGVDDFLVEDYAEEVAYAQENFDSVVEHWRERAIGFNGPDANASKLLEATIIALPDFFRPHQ